MDTKTIGKSLLTLAAFLAIVAGSVVVFSSTSTAREATHTGCWFDLGGGTYRLDINKLPNRGNTFKGTVYVNNSSQVVKENVSIPRTWGPDDMKDTGDEVGAFVSVTITAPASEYYRFEWGRFPGTEEFGVARFFACPGQDTTTTTIQETTTTTEPQDTTTTTTEAENTTTTEQSTTTTEPTTIESTTTTEATTTTTGVTTTTVDETPTTQAESTTTQPTTTTTIPDSGDTPELPRTGPNIVVYLLAAAAALSAGGALMYIGRNPAS